MSIHVALNHKTIYKYDRLVTLSPQVIRLRPAPHARTAIHSYSLRVTPATHFINWQQDPYSNYLARVVFPQLTREFVVEVDLVAEMTAINPFDFFVERSAENYPFKYEEVLARELTPYLITEPAGPALQKLIAATKKSGIRTTDFLVELNMRINSMVKYTIRLEPGLQTCEQTLGLASGSCRDSAWLLVQLLRNHGIAARFVSGYLIQLKPDVASLDGPSGTSVDFTDLHAWAEAFIPGAGWVGLDATSGLLTGEGHIPLACTAEAVMAAPITGAVDECEVTFHHEMSIRRLLESPRVTKPYTDEQWKEINSLGQQIDDELKLKDVRMTMGGEPTFVGIDNVDDPEWNTEADGPNKRKLASGLIKRLRAKFAPGGLLHYGLGKWYPGEALPRWALACYWRKDGVPVWDNVDLIANESIDYGYSDTDAQRFITALADRLEVDPLFALPGYEDVWYYLYKERRLPTNVDPLESKLENPLERKRLAKIFDQGLGKIVGYTLPLRAYLEDGAVHWMTGPWFFRPERMYLIPGDSPMGLRLPLDSLPWTAPQDAQPLFERDPMEALPALADPREARRRAALMNPSRSYGARQPYLVGAPTASGFSSHGGEFDPSAFGGQNPFGQPFDRPPFSMTPPKPGESPTGLIKTALCVEPRNGRLHVFMPPTQYLEDYLDLISRIEETASALEIPVIIEGYRPPYDPRINQLKVTPDPGVIEVNTQPTTTWKELVDTTTILYEEARLSRLRTEKFMLDGRHTGTGGGNHIVIGGSTPANSPILRRPHLLRSLLGYWHNHPSLSYLFSGAFIGPTSQAPRVDESRRDMLYELELAFKQIPDNGPVQPWLVDRIFRHLLVDLTGNTHRAEFCIDKLYSPDASADRLGLVECRGFEMPPHAQMSLAQHLLLRAMISWFWDHPYKTKLVHWGTQIHDRFLLPHFVKQDFDDVVENLNEAGYPVDTKWFDPHVEFRFPAIGGVNHRGVEFNLRQAIEPWYVLGEEPAGGSTVRFVDSSVERVEVKVDGMIDTRHLITCNGVEVPLHPTGINGQYVAGVRYRAWQPPSCLHPTIGVHSPLTFDIVDSWNGRSIGGCVYHVSHPGGRSHTNFPVNSLEAEGRRLARFFKFGHTPGPMLVRHAEPTADFPFTLDMRRFSI
jgi:uncharacterized protein (DUF2126 family)/transglutaminase-like putative cysteine protease